MVWRWTFSLVEAQVTNLKSIISSYRRCVVGVCHKNPIKWLNTVHTGAAPPPAESLCSEICPWHLSLSSHFSPTSFLQDLYPASLLHQAPAPSWNALPSAYLQDLLVPDYCPVGRLAISRILVYWVVWTFFFDFLCWAPLTVDPWKSLSSIPAAAEPLSLRGETQKLRLLREFSW